MKITSRFWSFYASLVLVASICTVASSARAQGYIPTATLSSTPGGGGTYNYTLTLSNGAAATDNIGSFWYAWIPGQFYLPTSPQSVSAPGGWTGAKFDYFTTSSIQWSANTPTDALAPGDSISFGFVSTDAPSVLAGNSANYPGTPIGTSFVYSGGFFSDAGGQFVVQSVPEPSSFSLLAMGSLATAIVGRRKLLRVNP